MVLTLTILLALITEKYSGTTYVTVTIILINALVHTTLLPITKMYQCTYVYMVLYLVSDKDGKTINIKIKNM